MGGTYWYYYVLDGDLEYHDPAEPSTTLCPLLPGQMVNVLDVPVQGKVLFGGSRNVSSSSLDSAVFTLDPKDKYLPAGVRRVTTTSAVHSRKALLPATIRPMIRTPRNGSTEEEVAPQTSKMSQALLILERQRSILSVFHRMRQTRSACSNTKSSLVWPGKIISRDGHPLKQDVPEPATELPKLPCRAPSLPSTRMRDGHEMPIELPWTMASTDRAPTNLTVNFPGLKNNISPSEQLPSGDYSQSALSHEIKQGSKDGQPMWSVRDSEASFLSSCYTPLEQLKDTVSYFVPTLADKKDDMALSDHHGGLNLALDVEEMFTGPTKMPLDEQTTIQNAFPSTEPLGSLEPGSHSAKYDYAESLASYATSANFSPCLASNTTHSGHMSPYHLSQPETPVMSEVGDDFLPPLRESESLTQMGRSTSSDLDLLLVRPSSRAALPELSRPRGGDTQNSHAKLDGFQGYSLPDHDHASILTIRRPPSITFKKTDGASPFTPKGNKQDLVRSWNDGSEHRMTALGELVDDLGYLGRVII